MADDDETQTKLVPAIALQLMEASSRGLAHTTNTLIDNLTAERDDLEATLKAVREGIGLLVTGQWMPTSDAILRALHPSDEYVDQHRRATVE